MAAIPPAESFVPVTAPVTGEVVVAPAAVAIAAAGVSVNRSILILFEPGDTKRKIT